MSAMYCGISASDVGSEAFRPAMSARRVSEREILEAEEEHSAQVHEKPHVLFKAAVRSAWGEVEKP
jgi:hypothetical protein